MLRELKCIKREPALDGRHRVSRAKKSPEFGKKGKEGHATSENDEKRAPINKDEESASRDIKCVLWQNGGKKINQKYASAGLPNPIEQARSAKITLLNEENQQDNKVAGDDGEKFSFLFSGSKDKDPFDDTMIEVMTIFCGIEKRHLVPGVIKGKKTTYL